MREKLSLSDLTEWEWHKGTMMEDQNRVQKSKNGLNGAQDTVRMKHEGDESVERQTDHKEYFNGGKNILVIKP